MEGHERHCKQCGTCCRKGGPILHRADLTILENGAIQHDNLVTIRKGEPVIHPLRPAPERADHEMIKVCGQGDEWVCHFFNQGDNTCGIYHCRPLECRLLKCWDPGDLAEIIGRDTISRSDVISQNHPVLQSIMQHDQECPWDAYLTFADRLTENSPDEESLAGLTSLIRHDLAIRSLAVRQFNLSVDLELFYFGRPLFTVLHAYGLELYEHGAKINLRPTRQAL